MAQVVQELCCAGGSVGCCIALCCAGIDCAGGCAVGGPCTPCYVPPCNISDIPVAGCGSPCALATDCCHLDPAQVGNPCYKPYGDTNLTYCADNNTYVDQNGNVVDTGSVCWNGAAQSGETDPLTGQNESTSKNPGTSSPTPTGGGGGGMKSGSNPQTKSAQANYNALNSLSNALSKMGQTVGSLATKLVQGTSTAVTGAKARVGTSATSSDLLILVVIAALVIGGIFLSRSETSE